MKLFSFSRVVIVVSLVLLGAGGYGWTVYRANSAATHSLKSQKTVAVTRADMTQTLKALGQTEIVNEQKIRFNIEWKVAVVSVKEWQSVQQDQVIAELDMADLNNTLRQSEITIANAELKISQLLRPAEDSTREKAQNSISSLETQKSQNERDTTLLLSEQENKRQSLANALADTQKDLETKQQTLDLAQKDLADTQKLQKQSVAASLSTNALKVKTAATDRQNTLDDALIDMESIDSVFAVSDKYAQQKPVGWAYIGATDMELKNRVRESWQTHKTALVQLQWVSPTDRDGVLRSLRSVETEYIAFVSFTQDVYDSVTQSVANNQLSDSQIAAYKSQMSTLLRSAQSRLATIRQDITTLESLQSADDIQTQSANIIRNKEQAVANATVAVQKSKNTVSDAQTTLDQTMRSYDAQRTSKQESLAEILKQKAAAQSALDELLRGSRTEEIRQAENDLQQAKLKYEQTKESIKKYQLKAPFSGTIRSIDFQVGDNLVSDDTKYVVIQNDDSIDVKVLLDQTDVVQVQKGTPASMVFYAYPEQVFTGEIVLINGIPEVSNGVTSYEARIRLNTQGKTFYSGMTQNVTLTLWHKNQVLTLPLTALRSESGKKYVFIADGTVTGKKTFITTGLISGDTVEVVEGLAEWQKVLLNTSSSSQKTDAASTTKTQSSGSPFGGPPM